MKTLYMHARIHTHMHTHTPKITCCCCCCRCTLRSRPADEGHHGEISHSYSGSFKRSESGDNTPEKPEKPLDSSTENNDGMCMCICVSILPCTPQHAHVYTTFV